MFEGGRLDHSFLKSFLQILIRKRIFGLFIFDFLLSTRVYFVVGLADSVPRTYTALNRFDSV